MLAARHTPGREGRRVMVDYSTYRFLKAERHNKVLKLSFNRPENLNAVHSELHAELAEIFGDVGRDRETAAVLLTGEGRAFSAGGDIKGMQAIERDWQQRTTPCPLTT